MINPLGKSLVAGSRKSLYRWRQRGPDIASPSGDIYYFGARSAMSHDGDTVAISGYSNNLGSHFVSIHKWNGEKYQQVGSLLTYTTGNTQFGKFLRLNQNGTRVVICTQQFTNKVFVYDFNGTDWDLTRTFEKVGGSDVIGIAEIALSRDGNRLLLGEGANARSYLWEHNGTQWVSLGMATVGSTYLGGAMISISGNGLVVGSGRFGVRTMAVNAAGEFSLMGPSNTYGYYDTEFPNPVKLSFLNEDGTLFLYSGPRGFLTGESWDVYYYRTTFGWTLMTRTIEQLPGVMLSATGRLIGNISGGVYAYDALRTPTPGLVKVAQTVPHTATYSYDVQGTYPAISGDGTTIGRGQSSPPNSTRSSAHSYTVHRLTID